MRASVPSKRAIAVLATVVVCGLVIWRAWPEASKPSAAHLVHSNASRSNAPTLPSKEEGGRRVGHGGEGRQVIDRALPARATSPVAMAPVVQVFAELMKHGELEKQERRIFQAEKWEVDLAKALDLPANARLERRSGTYYVPDFKYPNVRVDRVYRMDGAAAAMVNTLPVSASGSGGTPSTSLPASGLKETQSSGTIVGIGTSAVALVPQAVGGLMDAGGGTAVWENAMVADHVMVQVQPGVTQEQLVAALPASTALLGQVTSRGLYLVSVPTAGDNAIDRAVLALGGLKGVVQFAEPDFLTAGADTSPNDPLFTTNGSDTTHQWHLPRIMAPRAWDVIDTPKNATVANETVVAVVDTGVDYNHPDLAANIWTNPHPGSYGYASDVHGWNFVDNNNNPMDDVGHGTHVAGIIGAIGNNGVGTSGVCWGVKILPLRIIKAVGNATFGTYSAAIAAMDYIWVLNQTGRQVAVANHSWGGSGYSLAMLNAINNPVNTNAPLPSGLTASYTSNVNTLNVNGSATEIAKITAGMSITSSGIPVNAVVTVVSGSTITLSDFTLAPATNTALTLSNPIRAKPYGVVHVAAAGNSQTNLDRLPIYPACLPSSFIISVGASDTNDVLSIWTAGAGSNYGNRNVHLFAPGSSIWSTYWIPSGSTGPTGFIQVPGSTTDGYVALNGTSMAAPQVAGALALVRMWQPNLTDYQARQVVIDQVDAVPALNGKCASGGRLNIAKVIDRLYQPILVGGGGSTGGSGISTDPLAGAAALTGRLAVATTGYSSHALAVVGDSVWSWGSNGWGELGDAALGINGERSVPQQIAGLDEVKMVAAGDDFSLALRADGSVWVWGANYAGQHGNGTTDNYFHPTPQAVAGLANIKWISAATLQRPYCLAVCTDGTVFAWGDNSLGQLGDGTTTNRLVPQLVSGLNNIIQTSAGPDHALALTKGGAVYAWGSRFGQAGWPIFATGYTYGNFGWNSIGDGPDTGSLPDSKAPILVPSLAGIVQVSATLEYSLAVDQNGVAWEWGHFQNLDTNTGSNSPVVKAGLNQIVAIATGAYQSYAQTFDGQVLSWGLGYFGSLGTGSETDNLTPQQIVAPLGDPIVSVAGGSFQGMALTGDGNLLTWGLNERGQLGIGRSASKYYPTQIRLADTLADIRTDGIREFGLSTSGRLYVWGFIGDIDLGGFKAYQTPTLLNSPVGIVGIDLGVGWGNDGGNGFMMAVSSDHSAYVLNTFQAPGNNPNSLGYANMVVVDLIPPFGLPRSIGVNAVAVTHTYTDLSAPWENDWHALFITTDGRVKGWGGNAYGQLGDNSSSNSWVPLLVTETAANLNSVLQVSAGACHSMALRSDGTVWTWGRNNRGQLGDGTQVDKHTPIQVPGLSGIVRISAGDFFSTAIKADGSVYAWGGNYSVTFAELSAADRLSPVLISGLGPIADVIPGSEAMLCLRQNGTAVAWSNSASPILARDPNATLPFSTPADLVGLSGMKTLTQNSSVDFNQAFGVKQDGTAWAWGGGTVANILGDGDSWSNLPVYVVGFGGASETLSTLGTDSISQSWYFQNFTVQQLLNPSVVGDTADASGDGIPNLVKYALGLSPIVRNDLSSLPTARVDLIGGSVQSAAVQGETGLFSLPTVDLTNGKHYLALIVPRNGIHLDVDYIVEVSTDMIHWQSGDPNTVTVLDNAATLEVYSATSLDDTPRQFMRLRIQRK